jgi:hypothetical protein
MATTSTVSDVVAKLFAEDTEWASAGFAPPLVLQSIWSQQSVVL